jgi:hypothetical protein
MYNKIIKGKDPQTKMLEEQREQLAVIIERVCELKNDFSEFRVENNSYHNISNGRLKKLENWRSYIIGAGAVLYFVIIAILPTLAYYYIQSYKYEIKEEMKTYVLQAIDENNVKQFDEYNK